MRNPDGIDELSFLTHLPPIYGNNQDRDTIWGHLSGSPPSKEEQDKPKRVTVFKNKDVNRTLKNYYQETIYNKLSVNPYSQLLADFHSDGTTDGQALDNTRKQNTFNAVSLNAADFTYLTKLGVYPINRLWILRRFDESVVVPDNLLDWGNNKKIPFPISTVIGWIPEDDTNFFSVNFSEKWVSQEQRVDQVLMEMLEKEFNAKSKTFASVPGWSQGLLMGFLHAVDPEHPITDFDFDSIPFGNPNVLQEAATRVVDPNGAFGLNSTFSTKLKTSYEQKFIGDVDPGSAMLDIIRNLTTMGTSDIIYFLNKGSKVIDDIRNANNNPTNADAWLTAIKTIINGFIDAITKLTKDLANSVTSDNTSSDAGGALKSIMNSTLVQTILASTVAKWKWPIRGGIGVITGENTTPWHLTIGNPYSPFVSMGNIKVTNISLDFGNDLAYNDIPTKLDVEIGIELGRNMGAQEIFAMFNNGYKRVYDTESSSFMSLNKLYKNEEKNK